MRSTRPKSMKPRLTVIFSLSGALRSKLVNIVCHRTSPFPSEWLVWRWHVDRGLQGLIKNLSGHKMRRGSIGAGLAHPQARFSTHVAVRSLPLRPEKSPSGRMWACDFPGFCDNRRAFSSRSGCFIPAPACTPGIEIDVVETQQSVIDYLAIKSGILTAVPE
jgi:hypothetical protein